MIKQPERNRLAELINEVLLSEGNKIESRLYKFEQSLKIFVMNHADLEAAISRTLSAHLLTDVRDNQKREKLNSEMFDVLRHLHNTVAAALSLVDHTRVFYNSFYRDDNLIPDYNHQITSRFAENGLAHFVKCLRQFCQHYKMPLINASIRFSDFGRSHTQSIELKKSNLAEFSSWTSKAKEFIDGHDDNIDLLAVMTSYRDNVIEYHKWVMQKLIEIHRVDLDHYYRLMNEIEAIRSQDPLYRDYQPK